MGQIKRKSNPIVKDGVQGIILVGKSENIFDQIYILVQDFDDRRRGDGRKMIGLPGGAREVSDKSFKDALIRELYEEVAINFRKDRIQKVGSYSKIRLNGTINNNHLFVTLLDFTPKLMTNDPKEVSKVQALTLREIIHLCLCGHVHPGSMRLIVHYLNGQKSGSLNEPATYCSIMF